MKLTYEDIINSCVKKFQVLPQVYFAPGRINLLGEHIDYNAGYVMPAAIEQGCWFVITPSGDDEQFTIYSADLQETLKERFSQIKKMEGWKNYVLGVIDQLLKNGYPIKGFNAAFGGNLPIGAGLSSSAAVECGLAIALNGLFELGIPPLETALLCQQAEHQFPGMKCGLMDQYASIFGKKDHILFMDCITNESNSIPFPSDQYDIVLFNSNVVHALVSGEYNQRRQQSAEGLQIIQQTFPSIHQYRDAQPSHLEAVKQHMTTAIYKRTHFVIEEIDRTKQGAKFLQQGAIEDFGKCMYGSHAGLRDLYEVSCRELDFLVEMVSGFSSVAGARMMGGGFGGCTINIIRKEATSKIIEFVLPRFYEKFQKATTVYQVTPGPGAHRIQ